jgi:hypothetical protein
MRLLVADSTRAQARAAEIVALDSLPGEGVECDERADEWEQCCRERLRIALVEATLRAGWVPHWGRRVRWRA